MANEAEVVKPDSATTTESTGAGATVQGDTTGVASPATQTSDNGLPKGLLEHLEKNVPGLQTEEDVDKQGADKATAEDGQTQEVEAKADAEATTESEQQTDQTETDKGPVPYERFQTVNEAKNKLEAQLKDQEEYVKAQNVLVDYCHQNNISFEKYQYWMQVAAAAENNPEQLSELLKPYIEQTQTLKGEILPPDLQAAVDAGEITLVHAKRLAKAEGQTKFSQQRVQQSQEQLKAQAQQRFVNEVQTTFHKWIGEKQKTDPDFKPSSNGVDGKFEFVLHKMGSEYSKAGLKDAQSVVDFAEKVYESVNKTFGRFSPKPNGQKVVRTNNSTTVVPPTEPRNHLEAVQMGAKAALSRRA